MSNDVLEFSYTGDILAHRRCPRAWSFEKLAGFHPYEQIQAMEGRLIHHAMEWMANELRRTDAFPDVDALQAQLEKHYRVLYARGVRTAFTSKKEILGRVQNNLFPGGQPDEIVRAAIEGAKHVEYEIRTVRKLIAQDFAGKKRLMLTGVLDLVLQQEKPLTYDRSWRWQDLDTLTGVPEETPVFAQPNEWEIWDYKGARADSTYLTDYARQLVAYAKLFEERTGNLPARCVLFFVNEQTDERRLMAIPVDDTIAQAALEWTIKQAQKLRATELVFQANPEDVEGGSVETSRLAPGSAITVELKAQCTACGQRFDCKEYIDFLGGSDHNDVSRTFIGKN